MRYSCIAVFLGFAFGMAMGSASAQKIEGPAWDVATGFLYNSNLSNAERSTDVESDFFWQMEGGASWSRAIERDWRLRARAFAGGSVPFEYEAFNQARLGTDLELGYKHGLGPMAPTVRAGLTVERDFFEEDGRSRWFITPGLRARQPLSESAGVELHYRFDTSRAIAPLFDGYGNEGGVTLTWEATDRLSFSAGYRARYGDVVSYAAPPRPDIVGVADVIVPGTTTFNRTLTAYRLEAFTQTAHASVFFALLPELSLAVQYRFQHTTRAAISYDNHLVEFGIKAGF